MTFKKLLLFLQLVKLKRNILGFINVKLYDSMEKMSIPLICVSIKKL
ncbi:hypothetical protein XELAEV_18027171mg [Xenopus laevis]|uniref:Uncharacterized protein n=1 Tax=Xenopus laevis TaxID=8355 RepID=A0A974CVR0_XENLA|nr:hypothetical protein XELAEV_18027171mg [Xenopus laevis]